MNLQITHRDFHTILAALRCWQETLAEDDDGIDSLPERLADIATNAGTVTPLGTVEIDNLCERLNVVPTQEEMEVCPRCGCADIQFQSWSRANTDPPEFVDAQENAYCWCDGCNLLGEEEDATVKGTDMVKADDPVVWHVPTGADGNYLDVKQWPTALLEQIRKNRAAGE